MSLLLLACLVSARAGEVRVMTDRLLYGDAQTVWVRSWHLQEPGGPPLAEGQARYRLLDPEGRVVEELRVEVRNGLAHNGLVLHGGACPGEWTVEVVDGEATARQTVWVRAWEPPEREPGSLDLAVEVEREGDHLVLELRGPAEADLALSVVEAPRAPEPEEPWPWALGPDWDWTWLDRVIRGEAPRIRHCYEAALRLDPGLAGEVVVGLELDTTATPEWLRVEESSLAHEGVERCILEALAHADYGPVDLPLVAHVRYPFLLRPEEGDDLHPGPGTEGELRVDGPPFSRVRRFGRPEPGDVVDDRGSTALWSPSLLTDADGYAREEVDLPPGSEVWEVRVAGLGGARWGSVTVEVRAR